MMLLKARSVLAGLWAGVLLCVGLIAAPSLFAVLDRSMAGLAAGRIFTIEAYWSLALGAALLLIERAIVRAQPSGSAAGSSQFSLNLALALLALACTVAGHFGVQPLLIAAREGKGSWSFASLHVVSTVFFAIKTLAVLVLAWRSAAAGGVSAPAS